MPADARSGFSAIHANCGVPSGGRSGPSAAPIHARRFPMPSVFRIACGFLAVALPASAHSVSWPEPGMNAQHTAFSADETVLNTGNVGSLAVKWTADTNAQIATSTVTQGGRVFTLSTDGTLYARHAGNGKLLWSVVVEQNGAPSNWGVSVKGQLVISNCQIDYDQSTGGGHGGVCAFDAKKGTELWSYAIYDDGTNNPVDSSPYEAPVIDGDNVIFGESDTASFGHVGYLIVLNAATGAPVGGVGNCGDTESNDCNYVSNAPVAAKSGVIYYNSGEAKGPPGTQGSMCALGETAATNTWCYYTADSNLAPTVANNLVLFNEANSDGSTSSLLALNQATGAVVWSANVSATGGHFAPAVANGLAYFSVGSNGFNNLYAVSLKTGKIKWTYASGGTVGGLNSGVTVANGVVYAQCRNGGGNLCMFDAESGAVLGATGPGAYTTAPPTVVNGTILVPCNDNDLCEYKP
jgi:outer membrane protein assembly factor BamB